MSAEASRRLSHTELALESFYTRTYDGQYAVRICSMLLVTGVSVHFQIVNWIGAILWMAAYAGTELLIVVWWRKVSATLGAMTDPEAIRRQSQMIALCGLVSISSIGPLLLYGRPSEIGALVSAVVSAGVVMIIAAQQSMAIRMFLWTIPVPAATLVLSMMHMGQGADAWILGTIGAAFVLNARQLQAANFVAEQTLVKARLEAEQANEAKSTFLATVSHEIRTPLNGVLGMAQVMRSDDLNPAQRERLDIVQRSGEALLAVLNDVLDMSKIEAGRIELEAVEFDLRDTVRSTHQAFITVIGEKGVVLSLDDEGAEGMFRGDPTRIRQILFNLLSNAAKFTERGEISVRLSRTRTGVQLTVRDTGIGMSTDVARRMFDKFSQADASTTRRFGGTGLGLSICRELAAAMGGSISVETAAGVGSTFTVDLPLPFVRPIETAGSAAAIDPLDAMAHRDGTLRILVAEDNETNQLVLRSLLAIIEGLEVEVVSDGAQAVQAWEARPWDVILMDVNMPVMDGLAATRLIRSREAATRRAHTPIIALTANAMTHQVAEYLAAGMDAHVAKPLQAAVLFEALAAATALAPESDSAFA